eukprot:m.727809 g.727809  ORF g.727809 m.727809 type:complete len:67 (-) comp58865_c0_seq1:509-709(-)
MSSSFQAIDLRLDTKLVPLFGSFCLIVYSKLSMQTPTDANPWTVLATACHVPGRTHQRLQSVQKHP